MIHETRYMCVSVHLVHPTRSRVFELFTCPLGSVPESGP